MEGTEIRKIAPDELGEDFLDGFRRIQRITELWVREETGYVLRPAQLLYEWSDEKRRWIPLWLKEQAERGGAVFGAFRDGKLVGFSSVDGTLAGESTRIANLTMLFVDDRFKRRGIGTGLFRAACLEAKRIGADRLFVSAVPSAETVSFYFRMGCRDAETVPEEFVDTDEDRDLELSLSGIPESAE